MTETVIEEKDRKQSMPILKFVITMLILLAGLLVGDQLEEILYPATAYLIRDITGGILELAGLNVATVDHPKGKGLVLNDFRRVVNGEAESIHGLLSPHCVVIWPFTMITGYYLLRKVQPVLEGKEKRNETVNKQLFLKAALLVACSVPFSVLRFLVILIIFIILWNTPLWTYHYTIGHDITGSLLVLSL
ncbi:MAG: hypothetical protein ACFFD4_35870, partial [Candidatus Odinarchaeota archaeon]